jgi:hypothetical protein
MYLPELCCTSHKARTGISAYTQLYSQINCVAEAGAVNDRFGLVTSDLKTLNLNKFYTCYRENFPGNICQSSIIQD